MRIERLAVGIALMTFVLGCGRAKQPWEIVHPVEGVVNYRGQPLADANITLIPLDETFPDSVRPTARTREDGTFSVGTYSAEDGAPAGEYKVLVLRFPVIVSASSAVSGPNDLPRKYSSANETDLKITIDETDSEIQPLELK